MVKENKYLHLINDFIIEFSNNKMLARTLKNINARVKPKISRKLITKTFSTSISFGVDSHQKKLVDSSDKIKHELLSDFERVWNRMTIYTATRCMSHPQNPMDSK